MPSYDPHNEISTPLDEYVEQVERLAADGAVSPDLPARLRHAIALATPADREAAAYAR